MAYDEVLAERVRDLCGLPEKGMFGARAFVLDGNMAVAVYDDDLIVRVGPDAHAAMLAEPGAREFDATGKSMSGWVLVDGEVLDDDVLATWVSRGTAFAATLPPK